MKSNNYAAYIQLLKVIIAVPGGDGLPNHMDWDQFKERFDRMSKKILVKMKSNADFMVASWKKAIDEVYKQIQQSEDSKSKD